MLECLTAAYALFFEFTCFIQSDETAPLFWEKKVSDDLVNTGQHPKNISKNMHASKRSSC